MEFVWYILVGILAGFLAGKIMRGGGFGLIVNLILGIVGGILGGWLLRLAGISIMPHNAIVGQLITSTIGAIVVLFVASLFNKNK